jgi:hypothetical protein
VTKQEVFSNIPDYMGYRVSTGDEAEKLPASPVRTLPTTSGVVGACPYNRSVAGVVGVSPTKIETCYDLKNV